MPGSGQISVFLSYVHKDDEAWNGAMVQTARDLVAMLESETGETVRLFVDHDMVWGEVWRQRLGSELAGATFLIPMVTPLYLRSEACRRELLEFARPGGARQRAVLPLLWTSTPGLRDRDQNDEVVQRLSDAQWVDWTANRGLDRSSPPYRMELANLADRLRQRLEERAVVDMSGVEESSAESDPIADLAWVQEQAEPVMGQFRAAFEDWTAALHAAPPMPPNPNAKLVSTWSMRMADALSEPTAELGQARQQVGELLGSIKNVMEIVIRAAENDPALGRTLSEDAGFLNGLEVVDAGELNQMYAQMESIGSFLRPLRPHILELRSVIQTMTDFTTISRGWAERLRAAGQ